MRARIPPYPPQAAADRSPQTRTLQCNTRPSTHSPGHGAQAAAGRHVGGGGQRGPRVCHGQQRLIGHSHERRIQGHTAVVSGGADAAAIDGTGDEHAAVVVGVGGDHAGLIDFHLHKEVGRGQARHGLGGGQVEDGEVLDEVEEA